jgi:hypothetical protein
MNPQLTRDLPVVIIACQVFQGLLERFLPEDMNGGVVYQEYGLHQVPKKINRLLQEKIDALEETSRIVLGYGLCGNGLSGLKAGRHTLLIPCVDDCIAMLLGSHAAYIDQFHSAPGTYYLSKGWLESGSEPLNEYHDYVERYGKTNAEWIMDRQYQNYRRLVLVAHTQNDLDAYRSRAQRVARFCERWDMKFEEILGSDRYVRKLVEVAFDPASADEDFIIIPPGGEVCLEQFLR